SFFLSGSVYHLGLHSFPTRRSSDLEPGAVHGVAVAEEPQAVLTVDLGVAAGGVLVLENDGVTPVPAQGYGPAGVEFADQGRPLRSEEHTSELQSLAYLVCRLLLEKK